ncbi:hypothetical protein RKE29_05955 [Streptomyces sp. B1866]|uniref:hypothetical protein n=1 Tax=Streptomyces sp. B1866 TaxID=3075431 RepID=UPI0028901E14|nr:hypothetical protein [Streptomyces sp. B1866]MDT3396184.1 hypothetical protein [Streptomyces sp. B1866]
MLSNSAREGDHGKPEDPKPDMLPGQPWTPSEEDAEPRPDGSTPDGGGTHKK